MPMQNNKGGEDLALTHWLPWLQKCLNGLSNVSVALRSGKTQYPLYRGWTGLVVDLDRHKILSHPGIQSPDCPSRKDYTIPVVQSPVSEDGGKISSETYETSYTI